MRILLLAQRRLPWLAGCSANTSKAKIHLHRCISQTCSDNTEIIMTYATACMGAALHLQHIHMSHHIAIRVSPHAHFQRESEKKKIKSTCFASFHFAIHPHFKSIYVVKALWLYHYYYLPNGLNSHFYALHIQRIFHKALAVKCDTVFVLLYLLLNVLQTISKMWKKHTHIMRIHWAEELMFICGLFSIFALFSTTFSWYPDDFRPLLASVWNLVTSVNTFSTRVS